MAQPNHELSVPSYLYHLIQEVEDKTGYTISLKEETTIGYDMETRFARPEKPVHEIAISLSYRDYAMHFLTSGAFKIVRFWSLPPEERFVPASEVGRSLCHSGVVIAGQPIDCRGPFEVHPIDRNPAPLTAARATVVVATAASARAERDERGADRNDRSAAD